jgi:selenocysteine-specific elongation factor
MHVLATGGHIDHGKSTLVKAMTGINPDRLKEEQERQMTIDLGFAWMTLPNGEPVGIIDVPGHRDFIENMIAGAGGIDAVMMVVAANEGVMPQTKEHLAIFNMLGVEHGIVALTKIDMIEDYEWIRLVEDDIHELLFKTSMSDAPIIRVSSINREGLNDLVSSLAKVLANTPIRKNSGRPRLPMDRVFAVAGFGTVVTGTLIDGSFKTGEEVEIMPGGMRGRIRGLQNYKYQVEHALPGSRVAANISGIEVKQISRGMVVVRPGSFRTTTLLDAHFKYLDDNKNPLRTNQEVKLFLYSTQRIARIRLIGKEQISPGEEGWIQIVLSKPIIAKRGDRFILRRPSPSATLGGGEIINPYPDRRYRRKKSAETIIRFEKLMKGSSAEILYDALTISGPAPISRVVRYADLNNSTAENAIRELKQNDKLLVMGDGELLASSDTIIANKESWDAIKIRLKSLLEEYHKKYSLRPGIPREELKSRLKLDSRIYSAIVCKALQDGIIIDNGKLIWLANFKVRLTEKEVEIVQRIMKKFESTTFYPPMAKEVGKEIGNELLEYLVINEVLIRVSGDIVFLNDAYRKMVDQIRDRITSEGSISVAQVRDMFETSRKYALAMMEHLDSIGMTVRIGDVRKLKKGGGNTSAKR